MHMRVLLDTNVLMDAIKFHVDIPGEARKFGEPFTLDSCVREIEDLAKGRGKDAEQANVALAIAKRLPVEGADGEGDRAILAYAFTHKSVVATNDKKLIKALRLKGIKVLRLRQKSYLVEE